MRERIIRMVGRWTGITAVRWRLLGRALYCFNYHRVGDPSACPFDRGVFSCTQDHFREHVSLIKGRFEVLNLERLMRLGSRRATSGKPYALITFDDGYIDNYTAAFPVLQELGVSAVFFIATAFVGGRKVPWWDEIAWVLRNASKGRVRLAGTDADFPLDATCLERSILRVLRLVKSRSWMPINEQVQEIREACCPQRSLGDVTSPLFVNWSQLGEMHDRGMDIGSHTHSHPILSHLDPGAQRRELEESKGALEGALGAPVCSVAYPVGQRDSYTPETCRLAKSLGYKVGFTYVGGINRLPLDSPWEIRRFAVDGDTDTAGLKAQVLRGSRKTG